MTTSVVPLPGLDAAIRTFQNIIREESRLMSVAARLEHRCAEVDDLRLSRREAQKAFYRLFIGWYGANPSADSNEAIQAIASLKQAIIDGATCDSDELRLRFDGSRPEEYFNAVLYRQPNFLSFIDRYGPASN